MTAIGFGEMDFGTKDLVYLYSGLSIHHVVPFTWASLEADHEV